MRIYCKRTKWRDGTTQTYNYAPGYFFETDSGHVQGPYSSEESAQSAYERYTDMMEDESPNICPNCGYPLGENL